MTTSKEFCNYVLEQLDSLGEVTCRPMMGEYLLYYQGVLVGGIYDERILLKETPSNQSLELTRVIPYNGAKRTMYQVEDPDNAEQLIELIQNTYQDLRKE